MIQHMRMLAAALLFACTLTACETGRDGVKGSASHIDVVLQPDINNDESVAALAELDDGTLIVAFSLDEIQHLDREGNRIRSDYTRAVHPYNLCIVDEYLFMITRSGARTFLERLSRPSMKSTAVELRMPIWGVYRVGKRNQIAVGELFPPFTIRIFDCHTMQQVKEITPEPAGLLVGSRDDELFMIGEDGIDIVDVKGQHRRFLSTDKAIAAAAYDHSRDRLAVVDVDGNAVIVDAGAGDQLRAWVSKIPSPLAPIFSRDGRFVALQSGISDVVEVYDISEGQVCENVAQKAMSGPIATCAFVGIPPKFAVVNGMRLRTVSLKK